MISTIHSIQFKNKDWQIDLAEVPEWSEDSKGILTKECLPPPLEGGPSLEFRVRALTGEIRRKAERDEELLRVRITCAISTTVAVVVLAALFFASSPYLQGFLVLLAVPPIACFAAVAVGYEVQNEGQRLEEKKQEFRQWLESVPQRNQKVIQAGVDWVQSKSAALSEQLEQRMADLMQCRDRFYQPFFFSTAIEREKYKLDQVRKELDAHIRFYNQFN